MMLQRLLAVKASKQIFLRSSTSQMLPTLQFTRQFSDSNKSIDHAQYQLTQDLKL